MHVRVVDLDGSLPLQTTLRERYQPVHHDLRQWGPGIRLACRFRRFAQFTKALQDSLGDSATSTAVTFYGSGDFHHVSLALLANLTGPVNLLVLDNHPDWMRAVPMLHCGTWLYHAARLPNVKQIFHVGGNVDFDNGYHWLAPWPLLRAGKIMVFPALRTFRGGSWSEVVNEPVRPNAHTAVTPERLQQILAPFAGALRRYPLYCSLDKDVLTTDAAVVNWDSGHLTLPEVNRILLAFLQASAFNLMGMDIVGDWSPVATRGWLRHLLHDVEHPPMKVDPLQATRVNEATNLHLLDNLTRWLDGPQSRPLAEFLEQGRV